MKKHGNLIIDKATKFPVGGKVIYLDKIFKIINYGEEGSDHCIIDNDTYGRMIVPRDELLQLYIQVENEKYHVDFKEYSRLWK